MGSRFIPKQRQSDIRILLLEKHLLERHYNFCNVKIAGGQLICSGRFQPTDASIVYQYRVTLIVGRSPRVVVNDPKIEYNEDIHMYRSDNSLCLYYPEDRSWTTKSHLFDTIIPWTHEWFLYYELYQITGKWLHPFVKH
jgi:hypothetical protein